MGYYLLDHPNPNYPQTRPRSAWGWAGPTGLVTVHTAEGALDRIAPDTGAENVAGFIASRSDAGGYHVLVDTDSTIDMAPDHLMTWHTAAGNLNGPGWGISAACRSVEWDPDAEWTRTIIARMGASIRAFWSRTGHDPAATARWIPGRDVLAGGGRSAGLVHHGDVQPGDRSDAWATHPRRPELDRMLIDAIVGATIPTAPVVPPKENSIMLDDPTEQQIREIIRGEFQNREDGDIVVQLNGALFRLVPDADGGLRRRYITAAEYPGLQLTHQVRGGPWIDITPETEAWFRWLPAVPVEGTPF